MLKELENSGFHSCKLILIVDTSVKNGKAVFMLKASATEKRKRATPKEYPLRFIPITMEEAKQEEDESVLANVN